MESGLTPVRRSPVFHLKTGLRTLRIKSGPKTDPRVQYFGPKVPKFYFSNIKAFEYVEILGLESKLGLFDLPKGPKCGPKFHLSQHFGTEFARFVSNTINFISHCARRIFLPLSIL